MSNGLDPDQARDVGPDLGSLESKLRVHKQVALKGAALLLIQ